MGYYDEGCNKQIKCDIIQNKEQVRLHDVLYFCYRNDTVCFAVETLMIE